MQSFFTGTCLGIEVTSRSLRLGALEQKGGSSRPLTSAVVDVPAGLVSEGFAVRPFADGEALAALVRSGIGQVSSRTVRRAGLSLPDGMFRVQVLEFDDLPPGARDRERLIRWRLEKGSAFDMANTRLRYQVHAKPESGVSVLACLAKEDVLTSYEGLFAGLGIELWSIAPSSFHVLNYYASSLAAKESSVYALAWIAYGSSATIIMEQGGPQFYRYKELRSGSAEEGASRMVRELDDSLHFYMHRDRQQAVEIGHLYLAGEPSIAVPLAQGLSADAPLAVITLDPPAGSASSVLAAACGAGGAVC